MSAKTLFAVALGVFLCNGGLQAQAAEVSEESPRVGFMAPAFTGTLVDGRAVSLRSYAGKAVLLNFWATWCAPCRHELPELNALAASLPTTAAVVVGVAQDSSQEDLARFFNEVPVSFPVVLDTEREIGRAYHARALPVTFLIDARGRILEHVMGPRDWSEPQWRERILQASEGNGLEAR